MFSAYTGNSAYCFSNSLHMSLAHAGMENLPGVGLVECMTGMPFGVTFLQLETPLFFPSPATTDPDQGVTCALERLGWRCELWRGDEEEAARAKLQEAIQEGPVLLGPLDMGFLSYDPSHQHKHGADHYIVALKLEGEMVQVHDPQNFPWAVLPLADLMAAWDGKALGYAKHAYTMRYAFREERRVSRKQALQETLKVAQALHQADADLAGPVAYGGAHAFARVVELLRNQPSDSLAGFLSYFALPVGARRCTDAAHFLKMAGKADAARLLAAKAETYGRAQYPVVQRDWACAAGLIEQLAQLEGEIAASL
jgi:hypothetical protein